MFMYVGRSPHQALRGCVVQRARLWSPGSSCPRPSPPSSGQSWTPSSWSPRWSYHWPCAQHIKSYHTLKSDTHPAHNTSRVIIHSRVIYTLPTTHQERSYTLPTTHQEWYILPAYNTLRVINIRPQYIKSDIHPAYNALRVIYIRPQHIKSDIHPAYNALRVIYTLPTTY